MKLEEIYFKRNPDFVFRKIVDELMLVPIRQKVADMDCIYTLNKVGSFIWERLNGETSLEELQQAVADNFTADDAQDTDADVIQFLEELEQAGAARRV